MTGLSMHVRMRLEKFDGWRTRGKGIALRCADANGERLSVITWRGDCVYVALNFNQATRRRELSALMLANKVARRASPLVTKRAKMISRRLQRRDRGTCVAFNLDTLRVSRVVSKSDIKRGKTEIKCILLISSKWSSSFKASEKWRALLLEAIAKILPLEVSRTERFIRAPSGFWFCTSELEWDIFMWRRSIIRFTPISSKNTHSTIKSAENPLRINETSLQLEWLDGGSIFSNEISWRVKKRKRKMTMRFSFCSQWIFLSAATSLEISHKHSHTERIL